MTNGGVLGAGRLGPISVNLAGTELHLPTAACSDLGVVAGPDGRSIDLIVGLDALGQTRLEIDFQRQRLSSQVDSPPLDPSACYRVARGRLGEALICIRAGRFDFMALVDTGNVDALVVSSELAQAAQLRSTLISDALAVGPAGLLTEAIYSVSELSIGQTRFHDVPSAEPPVWTASAPAIIGVGLLSRFDISLDLSHDCIGLAPIKSRLGNAFLRDRSGLGLKIAQDRLTIVHVASHSPAAAQDVAVGDEILTVDGRRVDSGYLENGLWRWRFDPLRSRVRLRLAHGKEVDLRLGRYY